MAINLASKYSDQIAEVFTRASFIKGKTAETYDLTGVKTLKVYTPITVEEVDYDRDGGLKRYGDVTEMLDFANALGSLVTTKKGAIPAIPTIEEINRCMEMEQKLIPKQ